MRRFVLLLVLPLSIGLLAASAAWGQVSLTEINAASAISQDMQGRNAAASTGAGDASAEPTGSAPAAESVGIGGVKYIPAYAIVLMLIGLSTFVVCRPSRRHSAD
jgi:hypothetical protein